MVQAAREQLSGLGYYSRQFEFVEADVFDYLASCELGQFDVILCLGFFYHTIRQVELLENFRRLQPHHVVLDTYIARGNFKLKPYTSAFGKSMRGNKNDAILALRSESHKSEASTTESIDLVAWPTKSFIETMFPAYGFSLDELAWRGINDWTGIRDYQAGDRVSYLATLQKEVAKHI